MKVFGRILPLVILAIFIAGIALTANEADRGPISRVFRDAGDMTPAEPPILSESKSGSRVNYDCRLKVFMAEKVGRWNDNSGKPFDHNLLSFAFDTTLSLAYQETYQETKIWNAGGFANAVYTADTNMMAIAALYNSEVSGVGDSDPYAPVAAFNIHLTDACATAIDGHPGSDTAYGIYTHTVLVEDASTTW